MTKTTVGTDSLVVVYSGLIELDTLILDNTIHYRGERAELLSVVVKRFWSLNTTNHTQPIAETEHQKTFKPRHVKS